MIVGKKRGTRVDLGLRTRKAIGGSTVGSAGPGHEKDGQVRVTSEKGRSRTDEHDTRAEQGGLRQAKHVTRSAGSTESPEVLQEAVRGRRKGRIGAGLGMTGKVVLA